MNLIELIKKHKIIIFIFMLALLIRIVFVFSMPIPLWDETIYLNLGFDLSSNPLDYSFTHGWSDFIPSAGDPNYAWPKAGFRAPLLPYLLSIFYLFGLGFITKFLMPLVGTLSIILIYILGKDLFNKKIAIISSLIFALIPLHVFYSGRTLTGVLFTFFILLTFISFWKGYEKNNKTHKILFGIFLALALLSRYTALWIMPVFLIYFLIRDKSIKFLKDKYLWYSVLVFFIILIPWFIYGYYEYSNPLGAFIHGAKASIYWGGIQSWTFFFNNWWNMFSITGWIFPLSLIYLCYKKKLFHKQIYLLLTWFIIFLGLAIYMPHKEERFLLAIVPPLTLVSGYFLSQIKKHKKLIIWIIALILLLSLAFNFYNTSKIYYNTNTDCFDGVGRELQNLQGDLLVISENPPIFRYYSPKENAYYPGDISEETLNEIINSTNKKVYFVFTRFNSGFETEKWKNLNRIMKKDYQLVFECSKDPEVNWIYSN
jgi:4-amino-4-deoxy-L-arabinose transferase-like glycosyltransferase